jgi:hypothetical protein
MTLTPRDKRMLQVLAVVAGLALVYFVFTTVLAGDDGGEVAAPTGSTGGVVTPTVSPSATASPTPRETLPPVDLAGARDPFSIPPGLQTGTPSGSVSPPTTATSPPPTGGGTTPPATTTSPPPTGGGTTPPPTSPPPTSPTPPPLTDAITIGGHDVRLESINNERKRLDVQVDGKLWTVEEGARFADTFKLVKIDGPCARFLFGDQSFQLCLK